jgi:hypothetical protein
VIIAITNPKYALIGTAVFIAFLLIYFIAQKFTKRNA